MLIRNVNIITLSEPNEILWDYSVLLEGDTIVKIGSSSEMEAYSNTEDILEGCGQFLMPGNICAHTHFYGVFSRGMSIPGAPARDFPEILNKLWWPLDKALDEESVKYSAKIMLVDAIRNGTTTLIDHHASPNFIDGSLDVIGEEVVASGLRGVLCYEVTDRDGMEKAHAGIRENVRFIRKCNDVSTDQLAGTFGLHAGLTISEDTMAACRDAVGEEVGFHIHVAEHEEDEYDSIRKSGLRVVDRLALHKILGPQTIVAHGIHIDAKEIGLLADSNTWVTHQPRSNMNNGVGAAPVEAQLRAGIPVCLGTDGFPHAMWEEARFAYMLQKAAHRDPRRMPGNVVMDMLYGNNRKLANIFFPGKRIGVIEEGAYADIILVDFHPFTPFTPGNFPWQVIFGFAERMITTTIAGGKILMKDRELTFLDEEEIANKAKDLAPKVWERYLKWVPA